MTLLMKYKHLKNRVIHTLHTSKLAFAGLFVVHKNADYIHFSFPIYLLTFDSWSFNTDARIFTPIFTPNASDLIKSDKT